MAKVFIVSLQGELRRIVECLDEHVPYQALSDEAILTIAPPTEPAYWDFLNQYWVVKLSQPSIYHEWDPSTHAWIDPRVIEQVKVDQWNLIKSSRDAALLAPLTTIYGVFDADTISQKNITDAIALLQVLEATGTPQTIDFTLYDNSVVTLTTAEMIQVGIVLGSCTQGVYAVSRDLRDQINNSTTIPEVQAVTWPA